MVSNLGSNPGVPQSGDPRPGPHQPVKCLDRPMCPLGCFARLRKLCRGSERVPKPVSSATWAARACTHLAV